MKNIAKSAAKQSGKLARDIARQVAKDVGEIPKQAVGIKDPSQSQSVKLPAIKPIDVKKEAGEFSKAAVKQITRTSPIVEAIQQSDGKTAEISKEDEAKITEEGLRKVEKLEAEIAKLRQKRTVSEAERKQKAEEQTQEKIQKPGTPILPTSKPTRGAAKQSPAGRKQRKIESRLGKS